MLHDYFARMTVYSAGRKEAVLAGELRSDLRARGIQVHLPDALIGATAAARRATIVTANARDLRHLGVPILHLNTT